MAACVRPRSSSVKRSTKWYSSAWCSKRRPSLVRSLYIAAEKTRIRQRREHRTMTQTLETRCGRDVNARPGLGHPDPFPHYRETSSPNVTEAAPDSSRHVD